MAHQLIGPFVVFGCVVLTILVAQAFAARTAHLRLELFRPYRGDGWPVGVQEDDDFQFNWLPQAAPGSAVVAELPTAARTAEIVDALSPIKIDVAPVRRVRITPSDNARRNRA